MTLPIQLPHVFLTDSEAQERCANTIILQRNR